jgi:hypothetical protein
MYYMGADTDTVKPIHTKRQTWTRSKFPRRTMKFLIRPGRKPKNRRGFPVGLSPVAVMGKRAPLRLDRPGTTAEETEESIWLGTPLPRLDLSMEPGQQLGGLMDVFKVPTLTPGFVPSAPTAVIAPATSWWDKTKELIVPKDFSLQFDPIRALSNWVSPEKMESAVDKMRRLGIDPTYKGVPLTGSQVGLGYRLAGIDWVSYMPWIIGGGAALFLLPMLMRKRR